MVVPEISAFKQNRTELCSELCSIYVIVGVMFSVKENIIRKPAYAEEIIRKRARSLKNLQGAIMMDYV